MVQSSHRIYPSRTERGKICRNDGRYCENSSRGSQRRRIFSRWLKEQLGDVRK